MDNLIDKIVAYIKSLSREDIILLLFILSPAILTTILMAIGEADQRETQRRLDGEYSNIDYHDLEDYYGD